MNKELLFITTVDLENKSNGGAVYSNAVLQLLESAGYSADCFVISKAKSASRLLKLLRIVRAALSALKKKESIKINYFFSVSRYRELDHVLRTKNYSCIVFDHLESYAYAPRIGKLSSKFILVEHNVEFQLLNNRISGKFWGKFLKFEVNSLKNFESAALAGCSLVLSISEVDKAILNHIQPKANIEVVLPFFTYEPLPDLVCGDGSTRLAFVGNFDWWANKEAIEWFLRAVWDRIDRSRIELHLIGKGSERYSLDRTDVVAHGFIEDIREVWRLGDIYINPILSGSGVNIKVAEAIYNGCTVLLSDVACRGISVNDEAIVKLRSADDWINFLSNTDLRGWSRSKPSRETRSTFGIEKSARLVRDLT